MLPFTPFNQGGHDPNLQQAMLFNPNLPNLNNQMVNLNGNNNLSNFQSLNPYLQPMNNQLGGVLPQHLMALQFQGQINMLNQMQSQGFLFGQNQMLGLQNQLMQGNPMMGFVGNNNNSNTTNNNTPQMVWNDANASFAYANRQQVYHAKVDSKNSSVISQNFANGSSRSPGFEKSDSSHNRFQKFQSHDTRNPKGNKRQFNWNDKRGEHNQRGGKLPANFGEEAPTLQPRFIINYSENEIQQWCASRKKHFPSTDHKNKKLASCGKSNEDAGDDGKLRRQQLKEVLAKQAELGVEVAEIPPSYFREPKEQVKDNEMQQYREARKKKFPTRANIDKQQKEASGKQAELGVADTEIEIAPRYPREPEEHVHEMKDNVDGREVNKIKEMDKNGPFRNISNNKRRRRAGQKFKNRAGPSIVKREPSLLQKLLSADIRRDKSQLLQVFRFVALNDFFKNWPDKILEFPVITVKGVGFANEVRGEENPSLIGSFKNEIVGAIDARKESSEADEVQKRFAKDDNDVAIDADEFSQENEDVCIERDETPEEGEIIN